MTILATSAIRDSIDSGDIHCDPRPERIEGAHIDVHLFHIYWVSRAPKMLSSGSLPPLIDIADTDPADVFELREAHANNGVVVIPAGHLALCRTVEFIGTRHGSGLLPTLHTRSTLARWGIGCHPSAGWGDEGYVGAWTLEIWNPWPSMLWLPVGVRVGCIAFERLEGHSEAYSGRYNNAPAAWSPEAMLPRRRNW